MLWKGLSQFMTAVSFPWSVLKPAPSTAPGTCAMYILHDTGRGNTKCLDKNDKKHYGSGYKFRISFL